MAFYNTNSSTYSLLICLQDQRNQSLNIQIEYAQGSALKLYLNIHA